MRLTHKFLIFFALLFSSTLIACIVILQKPISSNRIYYLKPGHSLDLTLTELTRAGIVKHPYIFKMYILLQHKKNIKAGEYEFKAHANLITIWQQIHKGVGFYKRSMTIIPGWTFNQLFNALQMSPFLKHTLAQAGLAQNALHTKENLEGAFFPDTYFFTRDTSDTLLLRTAYTKMQQTLQNAWQMRDKDLPFKTSYEALIAASLVEKEAHFDDERPLIASVLINRLKANMLLQFDPTVIYALGKNYSGKITRQDLAINNPYNTYLYKGLPPSPIAIPSFASIHAIMHPAQTDYYYFVAQGGMRHKFSKNLLDHLKAVRAYRVQNAFYFNQQLFISFIQQHFAKSNLNIQGII